MATDDAAMTDDERAADELPGLSVNTDRELWRETPDDFYSPSVHVTAGGGIGINVGGTVVVLPVREWHALAAVPADVLEAAERVEDHHFHEDEPSPLALDASECVRDDCLTLARWVRGRG